MDQFERELKAKDEAKRADDINLLSMIESRIMEIVQIEDACKRKLPKLFQQRLPRFMRRRAASHNVNRLPRRLRPKTSIADPNAKLRKGLLKYRRRLRYRKHKRVLKKNARHKYKDPNKSVLHKWFAKRFKLSVQEHMRYVPLYNNTKNQRNLYRQTRYGCAYLSCAHLVAISLSLSHPENQEGRTLDKQLQQLNRITCSVSGFTFGAQSLRSGRYELVVHLYNIDKAPSGYICPSWVSLHIPKEASEPKTRLIIWVPREHNVTILEYLREISKSCDTPFDTTRIEPKSWTRIRLVGPKAREEAFKICENKDLNYQATEEAELRLHRSLDSTIGRFIEESWASFVYFATLPNVVDITFKEKAGRMLWHQLIKNKAHLVGGYRDLSRLLVQECFRLVPDNEKHTINKNRHQLGC